MAVYVLDHYYLAITVLVTTAYQLLGFAIAWTLQFDKITDFTGGSNFFILALLTLLIGNEFHARNIVASVLVMVWATRIAGFLLYRVLKTGSDTRFDEIRSSFLKFLGFWLGQIIWVWTVSLPLTILNSPAISDTSRSGSNPAFGTSRDIAGIVLWVLGWLIETVSDAQKFRYKMAKDKPKDKPVLTGLWKWSRHPPYFGETTQNYVLVGNLDIMSLSYNERLSFIPFQVRPVWCDCIPLFTLILFMFGSGVPTAEKPQAKKFFLMSYGENAKQEYVHAWSNYKEYLRRTSILIPIPPVVYRPLPLLLKQTLLLDFPMYQFDEGRDGAVAVEQSRQDFV